MQINAFDGLQFDLSLGLDRCNRLNNRIVALNSRIHNRETKNQFRLITVRRQRQTQAFESVSFPGMIPNPTPLTSRSIAMKALFVTADELNSNVKLFADPERSVVDNQGPFLVVKDDFYTNPQAIRSIALAKTFFQYSPPLEEQVGPEVAQMYSANYSDTRPAWLSSSLLRYLGRDVLQPQQGFRHAPPMLREQIAALLGENVTPETWDNMGDWWNGAFHVMNEAWGEGRGAIHHHYKLGDVAPRGWSGLVYLTPDAPPEVGTTIWLDKTTGKCIASKGAKFYQDASKFDLALLVENRFNRIVLFRENVLHRAEHGFGTTNETARLTQTFFFHSEREHSEPGAAPDRGRKAGPDR